MSKILVIGSSGNVGGELARLLKAGGHTVARATSRTPTAADQVHLDLVAQTGLPEAMDGVDAALDEARLLQRDADFILQRSEHVVRHPLVERIAVHDGAELRHLEQRLLRPQDAVQAARIERRATNQLVGKRRKGIREELIGRFESAEIVCALGRDAASIRRFRWTNFDGRQRAFQRRLLRSQRGTDRCHRQKYRKTMPQHVEIPAALVGFRRLG